MKITERIHALKIPFRIPVSPQKLLDRYVYCYIAFGDKITLIDTGVAGAQTVIFDYIIRSGRNPREIALIILTHSHPDHIGAAKPIREAVGCRIAAHAAERDWIEDTQKQFRERPVPGFPALVAGSVEVDTVLAEGDLPDVGNSLQCRILSTPGHSRGSLTLLFKDEKTLITGDAIPSPDDLPIYDDLNAAVNSLKKIKSIPDINILLSSWDHPVTGESEVKKRIASGCGYLQKIHETVIKINTRNRGDLMDLCRETVREMGLPPFAANPLVARSFAANIAAAGIRDLFD